MADANIAHLNPHAKQKYKIKIKIKIKDAPWSFNLYKGTLHYRAPNCQFAIRPSLREVNSFHDLEGIRRDNMKSSFKDINIDFKKIDNTIYEGTFYKDALLEEDTYGQGICKWEIRSYNISFGATGDKKETIFTTSSFFEDLLNNQKITIFYLKENYPISYNSDGKILPGKLYYGWRPLSFDNKNISKQQGFFAIDITLQKI